VSVDGTDEYPAERSHAPRSTLHGGEGPSGARVLDELVATIAARARERPHGSYTTRLLDEGVDRIGRKIGEEAAEVIIAAKNGDAAELAWEVADLWYHSLVLLAAVGVDPELVWRQLAERRGTPGQAAKAGELGEAQPGGTG
jgi:phosphoribosyl-ATP pyrophosphohydrolase